MRKIEIVLAAAVLLLSPACVVGPDYKAPSRDDRGVWVEDSENRVLVDTSQPPLEDWWAVFDDPQLERLIRETREHNLDVAIAQTRILEARALTRQSESSRRPRVDSSGLAQREGISESSGIPVGPENPADRDYYDLGFDASWELDLFGGLRRSIEASNARLESRIEETRDVLLQNLAETARTYVDLRGSQRRLAITQKNIELQQAIQEVVEKRLAVGDADQFDLARAETQVRVTEARLPNLNAEIRTHIYRLAVLTGREPGELVERLTPTSPLPSLPDLVPVGLRSDLLRRRPDIRRAERELAAETADIGVATAELFPQFSLTGSAGYEALGFGDLFQSSSAAWALGPLIRWPVFRGGEIRARIRAEEVGAVAAALRYEQAVLVALEDAERALVRYGRELETSRRLEKARIAAARALELAERRYTAGEDDILALIDVERELADVEDALVQSETRTRTDLIALYKALGGGWASFDPTEQISETGSDQTR